MGFNIGQLAVGLARAQEAAREREAERLKNQLVQQQLKMYEQNMANQALNAWMETQDRQKAEARQAILDKRYEDEITQKKLDKEAERAYNLQRDEASREWQYKLATFKAAPSEEEAYKNEMIKEVRQLESQYRTLNDENDPPSKGQQVVDPTTGYAKYVPATPTKREQIGQRIAEIQGSIFGEGRSGRRRSYSSSGIGNLFSGDSEASAGTGAGEGAVDKTVMNRFFKNVDSGIDPNAAVEKTQAEIGALSNYGATAANKMNENIKTQLRNDLAVFMQGKGPMTKELFNQFLAIRAAEAERQGIDPATVEPLIYEVLKERLATTGAALKARPEGGYTGSSAQDILSSVDSVNPEVKRYTEGILAPFKAVADIMTMVPIEAAKGYIEGGMGSAIGAAGKETKAQIEEAMQKMGMDNLSMKDEGLGMKAALTEKYLVAKMEAANTIEKLFDSVTELAELVVPTVQTAGLTISMLPALIGTLQAYGGRGGKIGSAIGNAATAASMKLQQLMGKVTPGSKPSKAAPEPRTEAKISSIGDNRPAFLRKGGSYPKSEIKPVSIPEPIIEMPVSAPARIQAQQAITGPPSRLALPEPIYNLPPQGNTDYIGTGTHSGGVMFPSSYTPTVLPYPPQPNNFMNALKQAGFKIDPSVMGGGGLITALLALLESGQLTPEMMTGGNRDYLNALSERAMEL